MNDAPIGMFDSGVGGLSVARAFKELMPSERLVYVGDTARVPYGSRNLSDIRLFSKQIVYFLLRQNVKMIVVACNTITVACLKELQDMAPVPVIGVIDPAVAHLATVANGRVGVLATPVTVASDVYARKLKAVCPEWVVWSKACPTFVPLIEKGLADSPAAEAMVAEALSDMPAEVDTLQLGCTHYIALEPVLRRRLGQQVRIVDSAMPTAREARCILERLQMRRTGPKVVNDELYFTDLTAGIVRVGTRLLGADVAEMGISLELEVLQQSPDLVCSANQCPYPRPGLMVTKNRSRLLDAGPIMSDA